MIIVIITLESTVLIQMGLFSFFKHETSNLNVLASFRFSTFVELTFACVTLNPLYFSS